MPNIPDIQPGIHIKRHDAINLLISSIALEEISLSHLINVESEKIHRVLKVDEHTIDDLIEINDSVERMMRNIIKNQMLLQFKLEDVIKLEKMSAHEPFCEE
ncbi:MULTISPECIES: hypothetical protein [Paenibacillus]|jgi:hypothetical protein|nr:hypothetical protein [Paenibacillus oceani]